MADPNSKKFIIIPEGTTLFPETGKKRVRVFEDKKLSDEELRLEAQVKIQKEAAREAERQKKSIEAIAEATGQEVEALNALVGKIEEANVLRERQNKLIALGKDLTAEDAEELKNLTEKTKEFEEQLKKANNALDENARKQEKVKAASEGTTLIIQGMSSALAAAKMSQADFSDGIGSMASKIAEMGKQFNESSIAIQKNTGLGELAKEQMKEQVAAGRDLGVTNEMMGSTMAGLNNQMSNFHRLTKEQQDATIGLTNTMSQLGVDAATTGRNMDILQQGMGLSRDEAQAAVEDFAQLAEGMGLPTATLMEGFKELGPELSRFGKDGKKEFEKLAKQSRALGISTKAAFDIGEAFDTFEGAADMAGKLNAQLGLQINSVEMLKGTHSERIQLLQQEFRSSGTSFDKMHRRQQQAVAEMMGVDVDVARKMFGDPAAYKQYQKDQEEAKARAERLTTINEKLASVADRLINAFGPLGEILMGFVLILSNPIIATAIITFTTLVGIWKTMQVVMMAAGVAAKAWWAIQSAGNIITAMQTALKNTYLMTLWGEIDAEAIAEVQKKRGIVVDNVARKGIIASTVQTLRNTGAKIANTVKGIIPGTIALGKNTAARVVNATKGIVVGTGALVANSAAWLFNKAQVVAGTAAEWTALIAKKALAAATWFLTGAFWGQSTSQGAVATTSLPAATGTGMMGIASAAAVVPVGALAIALGLLAIGLGLVVVGIGIIVIGFAMLVQAAVDFAVAMDPEKLFLMTAGLVMMATALSLMAIGFAAVMVTAAPAAVSLGAFAFAAFLAAGTLAGLGASMMLAGLGTQMAAKGFVLMKVGLEAIDRTLIQGIAEDIGLMAKNSIMAAMAFPLMTVGLMALGGVAVLATLPIKALGMALMLVGIAILMATAGLSNLVQSFADLGDAQEGLEAMSKVIEVSTKMDSGALKNLDAVSKKIIEVSTQISAGSSENLDSMAKILSGQAGGDGAAASPQKIILELDKEKIAELLTGPITDLQSERNPVAGYR